jgi:hypothetical protein
MRTTTNEEMVLRGGRLGQLASFFATVMVLAGLIVSFTQYRMMTFVLVAFGLAMYTVGSRGQEQAAREPEFARKLAEALGEFDDRYRLYHHVLPADHVLLTPHGVFVLIVRGLDGRIRCFKDKWVRDLTLRRVLRFFTEEPLGNPTKEMLQDVERLRKYIEEHDPQLTADIEGCVVFVNPQARLEVTTASVPVLPLRRLKSHIRKASARAELPSETLNALTELFEQAPRGRRRAPGGK